MKDLTKMRIYGEPLQKEDEKSNALETWINSAAQTFIPLDIYIAANTNYEKSLQNKKSY